MKPRTVLILLAITLIVLVPYLFIRESQNQDLLMQQFVYLGYPISVLQGLVLTLIVSILAPSLTFTRIYMRLLGQNRALKKSDDQTGGQRQARQDAAVLLAHGMAQQALELVQDQNDAEAQLLAARANLALGNDEAATPLLAKAFEEGGLDEAGYLLAQCYQGTGNAEADILMRLVARAPDKARRAYLMLMTTYEKAANWKGALDLAADMRNKGMDVPEKKILAYRYEWVRAQTDDLTPKKTIEGYQQILKEAPHFVPANLGLGEAYLANGAMEKAFRVFEQAFETTGNPAFLDRLERFYLDQSRPEDAIQIYRQLLVKHDTPLIHYKLGKLYYHLEMLDEALEQLAPLTGLSGLPAVLVMLAEIKSRRFRAEEALDDLLRLAREQDVICGEYVCDNCETTHAGWSARCEHCGNWDRITHAAARVNKSEVPAQAPLYF